MAIQINTDTADGDDEMINTINTTPLVDVMLVLLIIFLITIPVVVQTVPLRLPKENIQVLQSTPQSLMLSVDKEGIVYWNTKKMVGKAGDQELHQMLKKLSKQNPQPKVLIRADQAGLFKPIGDLVQACQKAGLQKIGFITEPQPKK